MIAINALVIALINLVLSLLFRSWITTLTLTGILAFFWSLANYYTIEFHGSPLYLSEFHNFNAAVAVLGGYHFSITNAVLGLLLVSIVELFCICLLNRVEAMLGQMKKPINVRVSLLFVCVVIVLFLIRPSSLFNWNNTIGWSWSTEVRRNGYTFSIIQDALRTRKMKNDYDLFFSCPNDGYSANRISANIPDVSGLTQKEDQYPDVVVILNESLFDLEAFLNGGKPTGECLSSMAFLNNSIMGYAVAPQIGGRTNDSEFELLMSDSMFLLNESAPFNFYRFESENSVVHNLKDLGFSTAAFHCGAKGNYSRNKVYPSLGFETIKLGGDEFQYTGGYGNRSWLDADNYRDMIEQYDQMSTAPRFMYLLTLQNHGGYEQNPPEFDTVHTQADFGDLTDDIDEYLTSIQMSAEAFAELTDYFSRVDRHVIICMVGDHAPPFINSLPANREMSFEETEIAKRAVPYVIWANYEVEFPEYTEYASMIDLVPMVLKTAGMPLTAYYQYILDMHNAVPVRTSTGIYMDRDGTIGIYEENSPYYDMMTQYYYMEYNALKAGSEYRKDLFEYR